MKMDEIRNMNEQELNGLLGDLGKEAFNLRVQAKTGQLQNSARIRQIRRDVARVKTELNDRAKSAVAAG